MPKVKKVNERMANGHYMNRRVSKKCNQSQEHESNDVEMRSLRSRTIPVVSQARKRKIITIEKKSYQKKSGNAMKLQRDMEENKIHLNAGGKVNSIMVKYQPVLRLPKIIKLDKKPVPLYRCISPKPSFQFLTLCLIDPLSRQYLSVFKNFSVFKVVIKNDIRSKHSNGLIVSKENLMNFHSLIKSPLNVDVTKASAVQGKSLTINTPRELNNLRGKPTNYQTRSTVNVCVENTLGLCNKQHHKVAPCNKIEHPSVIKFSSKVVSFTKTPRTTSVIRKLVGNQLPTIKSNSERSLLKKNHSNFNNNVTDQNSNHQTKIPGLNCLKAKVISKAGTNSILMSVHPKKNFNLKCAEKPSKILMPLSTTSSNAENKLSLLNLTRSKLHSPSFTFIPSPKESNVIRETNEIVGSSMKISILPNTLVTRDNWCNKRETYPNIDSYQSLQISDTDSNNPSDQNSDSSTIVSSLSSSSFDFPEEFEDQISESSETNNMVSEYITYMKGAPVTESPEKAEFQKEYEKMLEKWNNTVEKDVVVMSPDDDKIYGQREDFDMDILKLDMWFNYTNVGSVDPYAPVELSDLDMLPMPELFNSQDINIEDYMMNLNS